MPNPPYEPSRGGGSGYAPSTWNKESVATISLDLDNQMNAKFDHKEVDFILPFSTQFFDMRIKGINSCQWNEEFVINEFA